MLTAIVFLNVFVGRPWIRWKPKSIWFIHETLRDRVLWEIFRKEIIREYVIIAATYAFGIPILLFWKPIYLFLVRVVGPHWTHAIIGVVVCLMGIAAHYFKRINQRAYGVVEIVIGAASGFSIAFALSADHITLPQWASLIGCSYVVARGLNNVYDAKKEISEESA
jgi:hypothetical protein